MHTQDIYTIGKKLHTLKARLYAGMHVYVLTSTRKALLEIASTKWVNLLPMGDVKGQELSIWSDKYRGSQDDDFTPTNHILLR